MTTEEGLEEELYRREIGEKSRINGLRLGVQFFLGYILWQS